MIYIDVDTAVTVPVNIMPLTDDTDFKSREVSIAYNATGMDLVWNFITPNGTITQTAVTPTTAGDYDWSHVGDGMYKIEIPASGGASINNDTEGVGYFSGVCDGVLPWRGPDIVFRAAGLNDALIESAYSATRGLAGTALPAAAADAAGGLPISDAGGLDLDARLDAAISSRLAPTTAGRTLDITAGGAAGIDWGNVENPTTAVDLSATAISLCDTVTTNTDMRGTDSAFLASSAPTNFSDMAITVTTGLVSVGTNNDKTGYALSSSGMDSVTLPANIITATSIANDAITSAKIAADAIGASELAADAVTEIQNGLATAAKLLAYIQLLARSDAAIGTDNSTELGEINADGGSGAGDFSNQTDAVEAIADSGGGGPTAAQIADAVWDEATSGHTTSGTFGEQVKTDIDAILVNTAEIGVAGAGLTEAGGTGDQFTAITSQITLILADTNELQTDWTNGGRLDLIVDDILADTNQVQSELGSLSTFDPTSQGVILADDAHGGPSTTITGDLIGGMVGSVSGAVGSVVGNVGGNVTGTVGGIAGTITTLDGLDTAQDTQHATTLSKLLKYFQLLFRKDAAIATDNATELTAINADGGSGAGAYDNTTESAEALRDHIGDGTNLTEAGGTGDHLTAIDLPDQTMNITGNLSGSVGSVTGNVGGNVTGSVGSLSTQAKADVNAEVVDALTIDTPVAGVTIVEALRRIGTITSGKVTGAGTGTETFYDFAESASTLVIVVDSSGNRSSITYN